RKRQKPQKLLDLLINFVTFQPSGALLTINARICPKRDLRQIRASFTQALAFRICRTSLRHQRFIATCNLWIDRASERCGNEIAASGGRRSRIYAAKQQKATALAVA